MQIVIHNSGHHKMIIEAVIIELLHPSKDRILTTTVVNCRGLPAIKRRALDCDCYFSYPQSSWERELNENTNRLRCATYLHLALFSLIDWHSQTGGFHWL